MPIDLVVPVDPQVPPEASPSELMTVHLLKLCVGVDSIEQLEGFQSRRRAALDADGLEAVNTHRTRNWPRRADEVLDGGSLYWVIKGVLRARQRIARLDRLTEDEVGRRCGIVLDPVIVRTEPRPYRAFQGWRYLEAADAPADLASGADDLSDMPDDLRAELRGLGIL